MRFASPPSYSFTMCLATAAFLLVAGTLAGCGEKSFGEATLGTLTVTPNSSIPFDGLRLEQTTVSVVTLQNTGNGSITVQSVELDTRSREFAIQENPGTFVIAPGDFQEVVIAYTPTDCGTPDRGDLVITSNAANADDNGETRVSLSPQELVPQVRVDPNPIDFGRVVSGETKTVEVTLSNSGSCALTVNDLFLSGSLDFFFSEPNSGDPRGVSETEPDLPLTLEAEEEVIYTMSYAPVSDGFDEATLIVRSDDAANRAVEVPVVANGNQPCIQVTDEAGIDYGQAFIGEAHAKTITVTNCSQRQELTISSISLLEHSDLGGFDRFQATGLPTQYPVVLEPEGTTSFVLTYTPIEYDGEQTVDGAMLEFVSDDEAK
ncbi:MAG: choice-of-anchor D domain-containing protein, partial [Myxococcales bacterium]|nr:choice-of-anchor D domain-containing protein [Myxococcales bacterium]